MAPYLIVTRFNDFPHDVPVHSDLAASDLGFLERRTYCLNLCDEHATKLGFVYDRTDKLLHSSQGPSPMYRFASKEPTHAEEVRTRLRKMSDEQLFRFGKTVAFADSVPEIRVAPDRRGSCSRSRHKWFRVFRIRRARCAPAWNLRSDLS
jgi:hypothetical protein